jgi:hypothetical protein
LADNSIPRSLFVDFMYAVVVGATIVRIDAAHLYICNAEFWGVWFLIAVFMEDFYLYHKVVVGNLGSALTARQLIVEMTIVFTWYVAQVAFPTKMNWFLVCFATFFTLKLFAGLGMGGAYPKRNDFFFLIPIVTSGVLLLLCNVSVGLSVICLFAAWIVAVSGWWWAASAEGI